MVIHSFYNCENKDYFGFIGIGIIKSDNERKPTRFLILIPFKLASVEVTE